MFRPCSSIYIIIHVHDKTTGGLLFFKMAKYNLVAYLLWLFLGWFGVHHFYLGRDKQGILWLTSCAGYFGFGWLRDFYRIPAYVRDANEDQNYMALLTAEMRYNGSPRTYKNTHRIIGQVMFGLFYRTLIYMAIPEEYVELKLLLLILLPLGTTFGTYMVSNVGRIKSSLRYAIIGAYVGEILFGVIHLLTEDANSLFVVGVAAMFTTYGWEYDRRPHAQKQKKYNRRFAEWLVIYLVFCSLVGSYFYFNASVVTEDGERIKVREAVGNFFRSPYWAKAKQSFWQLYEEYKHEGWEGVTRRLMILSDLEGEERSLQIFNVTKEATLQEIKERYRVLAKQWHPDHHKDDKEYAQTKFMEIQEAYETIKRIRSRRERRTRYKT